MSDIILPIDGDIRPLEAKVNRFASKGINLNLRNNLSQPLGRITGQVSEFNKSLEASNARVLAFGASAGAVYAVGRAFQEVIKASVEVEKQLLDINVVLNASQQGLDRFGKSLFDIARNTANPFGAVTKAATELARQGLGVEETLKRTSDALILSRLSGLDAAKSVEALTAAVNSFSKAGLTSTQVINKLANVDAAFAVSSADLAEAISRVGSTAQDVGVDIDQLISLVTAAQQVTARGGAVIGNSFKTIFTRLQRSDTLTELENTGIAVRDLSGETLPATQILQNLAKTFNTLTSSQKASLAETVGGVYQINILRAALGDLGKQYSIYNSALNTSRSSTNEAIKRNEELNKSNDALLKQLLTDFKQASKEIGDIVFAPTIKDTGQLISKLLEDFRKPQEARSSGSLIATEVLKGFGEFVSGPGIAIATAGLAKIFLNLAKFSAEAFKGFMGIQSGAEKLAAAQQRINSILAQNPALIEASLQKENSMLAVEQKILSILQAQNTARVQATQISTKLAPAVIVAEAAAAKRVKGRAEGFIPNFANTIDQDQIIENIGAANHKGGYKAGKAYRTNLYDGTGKSIPSIVNAAEKRKDFINSQGKKASIVIPPNGFAKGFVPNFALDRKELRKYLQRFSKKDQIAISKIEAEAAEKAGIKVMYDERSGSDIPFINKNDRDKLTGIFKKSEEQKAQNRSDVLMAEQGRSGYSTQKRDYGIYGVVYPSFSTAAAGASIGYAGSEKNRQTFRFKTYPFPGSNFDINKELYEDVRKSLINLSSNYFKQLITRPQIVDSNRFKNNIQSNLSRSAVEGSLGQIFEAGVKASISSITTDKNANFDLDSSELGSISRRFKLPYSFGSTIYADLKNSLSEGNLNSMAAKIARSEQSLSSSNATKQKRKVSAANTNLRLAAASGFLPSEEALKVAIKREKMAGYHSNEIRVDTDSSLINEANPLGLGVYNTKDEPQGLKQGIKRLGSKAKRAGASKGFVPNFAENQSSNLSSRAFQAMLGLSFATPFIGSKAEERLQSEGLSDEQRKSNELLFKISKSLETATSGYFLGSVAGMGPLGAGLGALSGLTNAQGDISSFASSKSNKAMQDQISKLQDSAGQIESLSASITPSIEELIRELSSGDNADKNLVNNLRNKISSELKDRALSLDIRGGKTSGLSTSLLEKVSSGGEKDLREVVNKITEEQRKQRIIGDDQASALSFQKIRQSNNKPSLADNFINSLPDPLRGGRFEELIRNRYEPKTRQINVSEDFSDPKKIKDFATSQIGNTSQFLEDPKSFKDFADSLIESQSNVESLIDSFININNNIGITSDSLEELREALKLKPELKPQALKAFYEGLTKISSIRAAAIPSLGKSKSFTPEIRSNYAGVSELYDINTTFDGADGNWGTNKRDENYAMSNLMQDKNKNPRLRGRLALNFMDQLYQKGFSPEEINSFNPDLTKLADEEMNAQFTEQEDFLKRIGIKIPDQERGKQLSKFKSERFSKMRPSAEVIGPNGKTENQPVSISSQGETVTQPPPPLSPIQEAEQKKNEEERAIYNDVTNRANVERINVQDSNIPTPKPQEQSPEGKIIQDIGVTAASFYAVKKGSEFLSRRRQQAPQAPLTNVTTNTTPNTNTSTPSKSASPSTPKNMTLPKNVPVRLPANVSAPKTAIPYNPQLDNFQFWKKGWMGQRANEVRSAVNYPLFKAKAVGQRALANPAIAATGRLGLYGGAFAAGYTAGDLINNIPVGNGETVGDKTAGLAYNMLYPNQEKELKQKEESTKQFLEGKRKRKEEAKQLKTPSQKQLNAEEKLKNATKERGDWLKQQDEEKKAKMNQSGVQMKPDLSGNYVPSYVPNISPSFSLSPAASFKPVTFKSNEQIEQEKRKEREKNIYLKSDRYKQDQYQTKLDQLRSLSSGQDPNQKYYALGDAGTAKEIAFNQDKNASIAATKGMQRYDEQLGLFVPDQNKKNESSMYNVGSRFFSSQKELDQFKNSEQGKNYAQSLETKRKDQIKQQYEKEQTEKTRQEQEKIRDQESRSYDQKDSEVRKKKETELQQQQNITPPSAQTTNNISVAPTINLSQNTNNDEIKKMVEEKVQEFAKQLLAEVEKRASDRDKGNVNPPMGMTKGKTLTG